MVAAIAAMVWLVVAMVRVVGLVVVVVSIMLRVDMMVVRVVTLSEFGQVWLIHLHRIRSLIHRNCAAADQSVVSVISWIVWVGDSVEGDGLAHDIVVTGQVLQQFVLCKGRSLVSCTRAVKVELASKRVLELVILSKSIGGLQWVELPSIRNRIAVCS